VEHHSKEVPEATFNWVADALGPGATIRSSRWMGRGSTEMHALDVIDGSGQPRRLALRRFFNQARLGADPWYRPSQEAEALRLLGPTTVPAPDLIAADLTGTECDVPTLLMTLLEGLPVSDRPSDIGVYLHQAADILHRIHAIDPADTTGLPAYAPYYEALDPTRVPAWSERQGVWIRVLEVLASGAPPHERRLIHRDYHSGNILLSRGRITGVVDWTTACEGPRSIDLARMRLNLARDFDVETAERFLAMYKEQAGSEASHDHYWDLVDAADFAHDQQAPRTRAEGAAWERFEHWLQLQLDAYEAGP
jgi:aminoglycoside phosphotransferase (APT) family kinase protein